MASKLEMHNDGGMIDGRPLLGGFRSRKLYEFDV